MLCEGFGHQECLVSARDSKITIVTLRCPRCRGPVFVPSDSDRERVDCFSCAGALVTRQGLENIEVVFAKEDAL